MMPNDDEPCESKETAKCNACRHSPDMTTVQFALGLDCTTEVIVDVWCSKCGESGSTKLTPEDFMFD